MGSRYLGFQWEKGLPISVTLKLQNECLGKVAHLAQNLALNKTGCFFIPFNFVTRFSTSCCSPDSPNLLKVGSGDSCCLVRRDANDREKRETFELQINSKYGARARTGRNALQEIGAAKIPIGQKPKEEDDTAEQSREVQRTAGCANMAEKGLQYRKAKKEPNMPNISN